MVPKIIFPLFQISPTPFRNVPFTGRVLASLFLYCSAVYSLSEICLFFRNMSSLTKNTFPVYATPALFPATLHQEYSIQSAYPNEFCSTVYVVLVGRLSRLSWLGVFVWDSVQLDCDATLIFITSAQPRSMKRCHFAVLFLASYCVFAQRRHGRFGWLC